MPSYDNKNIRPVVVADLSTIERYGAFLRRQFVGIANRSCPIMLIIPPSAHVGPMISPSVSLVRYPIYKLPFLRKKNRLALLEKITPFKPTVIHCVSPSKLSLSIFLARALDLPYVVTFNETVRKYRHRHITDRCKKLIAASSAVAGDLQQAYPRYASRIQTLNIGAFVEDTCACFDPPRQVTSIIIARSLDRIEDYLPLLNAARHLAIEGRDFIIALIGKGKAERKLHKMVNELGLGQVVTIVPSINPLRSVMSGADIFIEPCEVRGLNSRLLEAMCVGMVIAADKSDADEILIRDKTAVFFDKNDELSIYSCLQRLMDDRQNARQIALTAQQYLRQHHSVNRMTEELLTIYHNAQL